ncbi:helicase-exonuclease AddAB subunit AddA [Veillonella ratti]|uniref:helicase-exonuclease AddAB subunit AddA n=1 Tax=Veillonella ratti TaxID=103892 RepID=UPI000F8CE9CA|nr:helicase-exonuclease AddAB subunit AddA [Veillonella ratti]
MYMKWTDAQQAAIDAPKPGSLASQTLLVAAAAGSGKTAVLVERIIQRLKSKDNPLSIQELMVVTFTKAAAAEMSARIGAKLAEEFNKTGDSYLEEQLSLLPSAHISTLHSFCQWVISSYFYRLDIDPSYRIGNEGELMLLKTDVLEKLLIKAYEENQFHIFEIADMFGSERSDQGIMEQILSLHEFALAQSDPEKWLSEAKARYENALTQPIMETVWGKYFMEEQHLLIDDIANRLTKFADILNQPGGPTKGAEFIDELFYMMSALTEAQTWDEMVAAVALIGNHSFKRLNMNPLKKDVDKVDAGLLSQAKELIKGVRESLKELSSGPFAITEAEFKAQIEQSLPYVTGLIDLTLAFKDEFAKAKQELGMLDFSDLEHLCLALLRDKQDDGSWAPSEVAIELQNTFKEVMVDEYQDTNGVQEAIVNLVSRTDNRFYVGDVKQSIYRFRMANPMLFMEKYHRFQQSVDAVERRIDLSQNFRSDANILEFTNFLFRQIMTADGAELDYGDAEALNPGRNTDDAPENWVGGPVELHLIDVGNEKTSTFTKSAADDDDDEADLENDEKETAFIIEKIKELKNTDKVVQNMDGSFRPLEWRDIVILLRSPKVKAGRMVEAMRQAGIPAYAEENTGYFSAIEVKLLLSLLQVIDNPEQDLPMAVVLNSPFVGLDANELGRLRMSGQGSIWSLLAEYGKNTQNEAVQAFVSRFEKWRTYSRHHSVSDLLWTIYEDMNYLEYVSAMPNGLVRRANVMALYERAKQYEAGSFRGIFRFLRFLESLQAAGQDLGIGKTVSEADNVVRIMSIHKSKGLEFPVVFLSSVQKEFNLMDLKKSMLLHGDSGVGIKGYYENYRVLYGSLPWLYVRDKIELATKAEEERILYVALTRARDKLFITGFVKNFEDLCSKQGAPALLTDTQMLSKNLITGAKSYLDWFIMGLSRHLNGGNLIRQFSGVEDVASMDLKDKQCRIQVELHDGSLYTDLQRSKIEKSAILAAVEKLAPIEAEPLEDSLAARFNFTYPYMGAVSRAAKISVSELKRRFAETEEEAETLVEPAGGNETEANEAKAIDSAIPEQTAAVSVANASVATASVATVSVATASVATEATSIQATSAGLLPSDLGPFDVKPRALEAAEEVSTGARWGTLMHEAMQWLPLEKYTQKSLSAKLDQLVLEGYFTLEERQVLSDRALYRFFVSDLGKRLLKAANVLAESVDTSAPSRLYSQVAKEWPFSMLIEAHDVYPEVEPGEKLFLQGIVDTAFLENGQWVLVDYKTDRVKTGEELIRRYGIQLRIYSKALERLTGKPVKERYIYSFRLHDAIAVPAE